MASSSVSLSPSAGLWALPIPVRTQMCPSVPSFSAGVVGLRRDATLHGVALLGEPRRHAAPQAIAPAPPPRPAAAARSAWSPRSAAPTHQTLRSHCSASADRAYASPDRAPEVTP